MTRASDYERIRDSFRQLEDDMNLFSIEIQGIHVWERLRVSTYMTILRETGTTGEAHSSVDISRTQRLYRMAKNMFIKNPFLSRQRDILFIGNPRRKQRGDRYWWDIYCDPITTEFDLDYLHLERPYMGYRHKTPARTGNLRYLDLIEYSKGIPWRLGLLDPNLTLTEKQKMRRITDAFESEFGVSIDFEGKIRNVLIDRKYRKKMYKLLLRRVSPKVVVIVSKSGNHVRIEACKEEDIPVVELQHGVIYENDFKHDFPDNTKVHLYPDYLFTFGEYWCEGINYPIEDDKVIPVGYPYLEMESKRYTDVEKRSQIVFISQGPIGEKLSRFAVELEERIEDYNIVYKLHPGEYDGWQDEYPWLEDADLRVVDGDEPPLYRLFAESKVQVGVGSTAVYEGLNFGLDTYVVDLPGKHVMEYLVENGYATLVGSVDGLLDGIEGGIKRNDGDAEYFFKSNAVENVLEALDEIKEKQDG